MSDEIFLPNLEFEMLKWLCQSVAFGKWHDSPVRSFPAFCERSNKARLLRRLERKGCVETRQVDAHGTKAARALVCYDDPRIYVHTTRLVETAYPRAQQKKRKLIPYAGWEPNYRW